MAITNNSELEYLVKYFEKLEDEHERLFTLNMSRSKNPFNVLYES
jgi:hypothetical protein